MLEYNPKIFHKDDTSVLNLLALLALDELDGNKNDAATTTMC
jgi:hypothetical protein